MRQVFITGAGGPEKLEIREAPDPTPSGDQIRIRVKACGVNFADILARQGLYPDAPKLPFVVGYEAAGTVDAVGPDGDKAWIGRDVFALTKFGGYADVVVAPPAQAFVKPDALSFEQSVALPVNYLTAWLLLNVMGGSSPGETVLIHNAGGGVGLAAIDIARHLGATIIGTASAGKHAFLRERGLHHAIDYRTQDWSEEVARLTEGRGVELVIDPIGGAHWTKSYRALRPTGRLGMFGVSSAASNSGRLAQLGFLMAALRMPFFHPASLIDGNRAVFGVNIGHLWGEVGKIRLWMEAILAGVADGWARPHVDKAFRLEQAGAAHAYLEDRRNIGKVALVP